MMNDMITRRRQLSGPLLWSLPQQAPLLPLWTAANCARVYSAFLPSLCILIIVQACCLPVPISACKISTHLLSHTAHLCIRAVLHVFSLSRPVVSLMLSSILNPVLSFFGIYRKSLSRVVSIISTLAELDGVKSRHAHSHSHFQP